MQTVHIYKATPTDEPVPGVIIQIDQETPEFDYASPLFLEAAARHYDDQANALFGALRDNLPGGTLDRLLGKMLAYKASHFRVLSWNEEVNNG